MKVVETALKTHEIAPFQKNFFVGGGGGGNSSQLRDMYTQNPHIFKLPPPPRNPAYAPVYMYVYIYLSKLITS